jgi:hypothetical protein
MPTIIAAKRARPTAGSGERQPGGEQIATMNA